MVRKKKHQKNMDRNSGVQVVGAAFYSEYQWNRLKELSADPENMFDSYQSWKESYKKTTKFMKKEGLIVKKVNIDVEELYAWCLIENIELDGEARAQYVRKLTQDYFQD